MDCKRIGVISDTHGLLRPEVLDILKGCDCIIHGGDIGKAEVIQTLMTIAPIIAVRGNVDKGPWTSELLETRTLKINKKSIYIIHDINTIKIDPRKEGIDIVISGHSHKPKEEIYEGILYLNPGSIGPRRFNLPISAAILKLGEDGVNVQFINILNRK